MNPDDVEEGLAVTVTSDRTIAGRSWQGEQGTVYSAFLRGQIDDWVIVRIGDTDIAVRPDEIEPAS
jgi:hypothetical protein